MNETDHTHVSKQDARAGNTPHIVRYVLGISLALIIAVFLAVYLIWQ
mgnify:CR=1 FL=1